jgi:CheY-like chemotaxis protein
MPEPVPAMTMVLVVDDDANTREILAEILEDRGYHVCVAEHGRQALQQLETQTPRLILLDLNMPVMDGIQFLERLRQRPKQSIPPVIIITAEEPKDIPGASMVLRKPIKVRQLLELVRALAGDSTASNERFPS